MSGALPIILIAGSWLVLALAFLGIGAAIRRIFTRAETDLADAFRCFWVGFAVTLIFLQVWQCVYPIDWPSLAIVIGLGAAGHLAGRGRLIRTLLRALRESSVGFLAILAGAIVWVANRATAAPDLFDSGVYHYPVIHWVTSYPIVKGLGNLDGHFGFNNVSLLYQGMLDTGFWRYRSGHLGGGLLLLGLALYLLCKVRDCIVSRNFLPLNIFAFVLLIPLIDMLPGVSSPNTDLPALLVMFVIAYWLLELVPGNYDGMTNEAEGLFSFRIFAGVLLCVVAPGIKLTSAVYSAGAWLVFVSLWLIHSRRERRLGFVGAFVIITFAVIALWAARTTLLTGYPFYPYLRLKFSVPWRIPEFYAQWDGWWIKTFARAPFRQNMSGEGWGWIPSWFRVELRTAKVAGILPLALTTLALAVNYWRRIRIRKIVPQDRAHIQNYVLWGSLIIAIFAWLLSAPSFRFGEALLWIMAAQTIAFTLTALARAGVKIQGKAISAMGILLLVPLAMQASLEHARLNRGWLPAVEAALWVTPGPDHGMYPVYKSLADRITTSRGAVAYQPHLRDCNEKQWHACVPWYAPLPSAQSIKESLSYLTAPFPGDGFAVLETREQWLAKHGAEVRRMAKVDSMNVRQIANYYSVGPNTIRMALAGQATSVR